MTGAENPEESEVEEKAKELIEKAAELGDRGARFPPEGQTCVRCNRDAVAGPGEEWLCRKHQEELFRERHGKCIGFGLAPVDQIVQMHDWMISKTEAADGGVRFEITTEI